jgi:hypothetical protein
MKFGDSKFAFSAFGPELAAHVPHESRLNPSRFYASYSRSQGSPLVAFWAIAKLNHSEALTLTRFRNLIANYDVTG